MSIKPHSLVSAAIALGFSISPAFAQEKAATNPEFAAGVAEYQKRNYNAAIQHLLKAIPVMERETAACTARLYLGHSYFALGDKVSAKKNYEELILRCYGSNEWKIAKAALETIANQPTQTSGKSTSAGATKAPVKAAQSAPGVLGRISILPPKFEHPAVSTSMITTVQNAIIQLPKGIRKILDDGGAQIILAPNISDKWPQSVTDEGLGYDKGRTYGREMYVFERQIEKDRDPSELGPAWGANDIKINFYTQVGLAVLDITGVCKQKDVIAAYKADCQNVPDELRDSYRVFLQDGNGINETCAEIVSIFLAQKRATEFDGIYSTTKKLIQTKLGL